MLTLADIIAFYSAEPSPENSGARRALGIDEEADRIPPRTPPARRAQPRRLLVHHAAVIVQRGSAPCRPAAQ
ncbi:hypothetical protein [Azospirillum rugosum]|uniref:Uncharacterized protein n=1 Tax=Azospirillum rugosum TaxID=416170 RepID=A0ABS4SPV2_9PROT|nr:hypothetical protein [Azospirillum rugosum]MBP2294584.1 hypothetical protein [Azospirillum rugosum]MDQ0528127.1 hypothetical protein [Azospirillum rugosum]